MFYWLSARAKYEVAMSYDSNFMDKVIFLPRHTDMIKTRCPEFQSDTQKYLFVLIKILVDLKIQSLYHLLHC